MGAALRAQQEKETDKKAELDALRAKRAMEQYERDWRQKERAAIQKQKRQNQMLAEARTQQKKEKERRLEHVAKAEREEFEDPEGAAGCCSCGGREGEAEGRCQGCLAQRSDPADRQERCGDPAGT